MSPPVIIGAVVLGGLFLAYGVYMLVRSSRSVDRRIEEVVEGVVHVDEEQVDEARGRKQPAKERLPALQRLLQTKPFFVTVEKRLIAAGVPLRPTEYVLIWGVCAAGFMAIGALLFRSVMVTLILTAGGLYFPYWMLNWLYNRRRKVLETQLADALTLMASSLKAGYGITQGLQAAAEQLPDPIAGEFARVVRLVNLGMDLPEALDRLSERVQSYDFNMVITAIQIQLRTGGGLADLLTTIAETIRARITLRREIDATTSQGKLSGLVLILLPVGIAGGLMIINPGYAKNLFQTTMGRNLCKLAAAQQVAGIMWIRKILSFDV